MFHKPNKATPLFFKTSLIFRTDKTILTGPRDQNVSPIGMKNDTDSDSTFSSTELPAPKSTPRS